jgi:DNA gyrase subunit A
VSDVSEMGRNTQGVRLIRLTKGEKLVEIEKIEVLAGVDDPTDEDTSGVVNSDADDGDNNGSESPDDTASE